jgi:glycerol uptake facilitator-like aquaporin
VSTSQLRRLTAEGLGTALLVGIGTGAIVLAHQAGGVPQWELAGTWFLAVLIPILLFVGVSGAHLNPAVTLGLAASGRIAWSETPAYVGAQLLGAFAGSGFVKTVVGIGPHLGSTVPSTNDGVAFGLEATFTAFLVLAVFVLADQGFGRWRWRLTLPPFVVGVATVLIGPLTGSSLNPARTIAPAVISGTYAGLWVYLVSVPLGALVAAFLWRPRSVDLRDRGPGRIEVSQ